MKIAGQAAATSVLGLLGLGVILFVPAGTLNYWQAWVFIAVFTVGTQGPGIYLLVKNPAALQRRMHAGPTAETRFAQKLAVTGLFATAIGAMVISALDYRWAWSAVPLWVVVAGDVLVAVGLTMSQVVVIQNSYAAANVTVEEGQELATTGLYGVVRHPMYVGVLIMSVGMPLALGSYWALLTLIPCTAVLAVRILDEERALEQQLAGYRDYMKDVRYRVVPYVW
ncbi:MAG TPA: isoprenylcysteine carboxylmethyltransferase family protein [Mycobacterium sp.]|nr:isoprenylcysteine carboxylmethyltransferase family protein [Mycobacterium sp.]